MAINNINKDFEVDNCYGSGSDIVVVFLFCQNWVFAAKKKNGYVNVERELKRWRRQAVIHGGCI